MTNRDTRRIAFIVSQFPRYVDIYFLRELGWLKDHGFGIDIFSLLPFSGKVIHAEAKGFLPVTHYSPFCFSFKLIRANCHFLFTATRNYFSALFRVIAGTCTSPVELLKCLALFPKTVYFARVIQEQGKGHIHANWATHPTVSAMVISKLTEIPFSFSGHASDIFLNTTMLEEKLREAKFVLTCTRYNKEYLSRFCNGERSTTIHPVYHGLDLEKYAFPKTVRNERFQILSVGSLRECKGYSYLIEACRLLRERKIDFCCAIVGDGPEKKRLKSLIDRYGLEEKIRLIAYLAHEELISYYQRVDVVALPALSESHFGIPNILIEALAARTPVICTPLPSIPELIEPMKSGLVVPERDPHALADALEALARDPELRTALAEEGFARVARDFDMEKSGQQLERIFLS